MSGSSSDTRFLFRGSSDEGSSCSMTGGRGELSEEHTTMNDGELCKSESCCYINLNVSLLVTTDNSSPVPSTGTTLPRQSPTRLTMNHNASSARHSSHITTSTPGGHDPETESNSSSVESFTEEDRVVLQIGEILKAKLEFDWAMVTKHNRLVTVPAQMPVVTILENFVKHYSIKAITCPTQLEAPRRRSTTAKTERREKDYDKLVKRFVFFILL